MWRKEFIGLHFHLTGRQGRNSNRAGTWRQELMQRSWRGAAYCLAPCGLLSLSYRSQDHHLGNGPTIVGLTPLSINHYLRKCPTDLHADSSYGGISLLQFPPLRRLCQVYINRLAAGSGFGCTCSPVVRQGLFVAGAGPGFCVPSSVPCPRRRSGAGISRGGGRSPRDQRASAPA